ncbi:MAG: hypothetical protein ABIH83_03940 [Candidatus Micrarchaeota archaeon]
MQTTIAINSKTKDSLKLYGSKGETYDEVLQKLMEIAKMHGFLQKQKYILENEQFFSTDDL